MSLLFIDGFDHYDPQQLDESGDVSLSFGKATIKPTALSVLGRRPSSKALSLPPSNSIGYQKILSATETTIILGAAFNVPTYDQSTPVPLLFAATLLDVGAGQVVHSVNLRSTGLLEVARIVNGVYAIIGVSSRAMPIGGWNFVELKLVQSAAAGTLEVRLNNQSVLSLTGLNTTQSGAAIGRVGFGHPLNAAHAPAQIIVDDFYVVNASGTLNNNFLGDSRVDVLIPNGAGANTQFTPSAGANFDALNELLPDFTDYVTSSAVGNIDTYAFSNLPTLNTPTVLGVQGVALAKKTDAGAGAIELVARAMPSGTQTIGTPDVLATDYQYRTRIFETQPGTTSAWTESTLNAAEFGFRAA